MKRQPYVIQLQHYSIHDGPGIRTTVFFKGCPLSCLWCHNPESQSYEKELLYDRERCSGCGVCASFCKEEAVSVIGNKAVTDRERCVLCGNCADFCAGEVREIIGTSYEVCDLVKLLKKDRTFYEQSGGGVTLSGGEVMTQDMDYLELLCRELKREGISVVIDTCGFAPTEHFNRILPYVDEFLYDIKCLDKKKHQNYTGQSNELILRNFQFLLAHQAKVWVRIPVIPGFNESPGEMTELAAYLKEQGAGKVSLLPYHNTGSGKYKKLGRENPGADFFVPEDTKMEELKDLFIKEGIFEVYIGG